MQIRYKLMLGLLGIHLLTGVVCLISILSTRHIGREVGLLSESSMQLHARTGEMAYALMTSQKGAQELMAESLRAISEATEKEDARRKLQESRGQIEGSAEEFARLLASARTLVGARLRRMEAGEARQCQELLDRLDAEFARYRVNLEEFVRLSEAAPLDGDEFLEEVLEPHFNDRLRPLLDDFRARVEAGLGRETNETRAEVGRVARLIVGSTIGSLLAAVFLSLYFSRVISRPIKDLARAAAEIGRGRLDVRVNLAPRDEVGALGAAFNRMSQDLRSTTVSKNYVDAIFRSMPDPLIVVAPDGLIQTANPAASRLLEYGEDELVGQPFTSILAGGTEAGPPGVPWGEELLKGGEKTYLTRDGKEIPVSFSASLLHDGDGELRGLVCVAQDISERRRMETALRKSEQRFRSIVETTSDWIWEMNPEGRSVYNNPAIERILGYRPAELNGINALVHMHAEDRGEVERILPALLAEKRGWQGLVCRWRHKDGTYRYLESSAVPITGPAGELLGYIGTDHDITDRKRAEEQRALHALLQADIGSALAQADTLEGMLQQCATSLVNRLDAAFARIWTLNEAEQVLELRASAGLYTHLDGPHARVPVGKYKIGFIAAERTPHLTNDVQHDARVGDKEWARREGMVSFAGYPLLVEGHLVGVLAMFSRQPLAADTLDALATVSHAVAHGIERLRAAEALRESELKFRSVTESAHDAIIAADADGQIISWNKGAQAMFGYTEKEAVGHPLTLLMPEEYRADHRHGLARHVATGEAQVIGRTVEMHGLRRDGTVFPIDLSLATWSRGGKKFYSGIIRDTTERKRVEEELQRARDAALESARLKSEFLANMSHEIRTPMNGVIGMTELALGTDLRPEQREYLEAVRLSADSLLGIINDILDLSKIEAGKLALETAPFDLEESVGETCKVLALRAGQKGLELTCHVAPGVPEVVMGDAHRLRQIVVNLVGNAVKFTERGEIAVLVEKESQSEEEICLHFQVRDTGVGVPPGKQREIFEAFVQADGSTTKKYGGTGLGLTISSQLVELMGGKIWLESPAGGAARAEGTGAGSIFHFTARFGLAPAGTVTRLRPADLVALEGLRVLVVDDNATNRRILQETLAGWRMRPVTVSSGRAALTEMARAQASGEPYPLVLLDADMPEMDGFAVAEKILQSSELASSSVMMLSSADQQHQVARCRELGLSLYLIKPVRQRELLGAIRKTLGTPLLPPPSAEEEESLGAAPESSAPPPRPLRVLLAEDNEINQRLAVELLARRGHRVEVAANGQRAVEIFEPGSFDVVLMDVQMPEMNGFEATAAIRERERRAGTHTPVIAMTAFAMKGDRERCLSSGMDGYLAKPINAAELYRAVERPGQALAPSREPDDSGVEPAASGEFDASALLARTNGDRELAGELARVFLDTVPQHLVELRSAVAAGDDQTVERVAHKVRGVVGYFPQYAVGEAALELEQMGREGRLSEAGESLLRLESGVGRLLAALAKFRGEERG